MLVNSHASSLKSTSGHFLPSTGDSRPLPSPMGGGIQMAESVLTGFAAAGVPRRQATTDAVRPQGARTGGLLCCPHAAPIRSALQATASTSTTFAGTDT